jgi:siroheme decarboxylase
MTTVKHADLDQLDRDILNRIQALVPLVERPFKALADELSTSEDEMINRIKRMWDIGVTRRFGPILNYSAWGMSGLLAAAKADEDKIDLAQEVVAAHPEITHAYIREHEWNLWFTVIAENDKARDAIIDSVTRRAKLREVKKLPMQKTFKLGVKFEV